MSATAAATASPQRSRGNPTTAVSCTAGSAQSAFSTSIEAAFSPPVLILESQRAIGVDGGVYRFFANKRDLRVKTVEHWCEDMLAHDEDEFRAVRGAWSRIRFVVRRHLANIRREPALSRLVAAPSPET